MKKVGCNHNCFAVFGNNLKYSILLELKKGKKNVSGLCEELDKEQTAVSHALMDLRKCNFVDYERKGKEKYYYLKSDLFSKKQKKAIFQVFEEHVKKYCDKCF